MRDIKFRAWDSSTGRFLENFTVYQYGNVASNGEWLVKDDLDGVILEQFTGLKDKEGKNIYEGDIVIHPDVYTEKVDVGVGMIPVAQTEENTLAKVVMEKGSWGIFVKGSTELLNKGFNPFTETNIEEIEVIGNIHQNPELL